MHDKQNPYPEGTPEWEQWELQNAYHEGGTSPEGGEDRTDLIGGMYGSAQSARKESSDSAIKSAGEAADIAYNAKVRQDKADAAQAAKNKATADKLIESQTRVTDPYNINAGAFESQGPFSTQGLYDQAGTAGNRQTPQFNFGYQDQTRQAQMGLMQQLQAQARGEGPSLAQLQLQRGQESAMANAMAMGASQRGANQAGALRNIGAQQAGIQQGLAADSAALRLQEQMQAQQMLAGLTGQMRGQDIGAAGQQTQFAQSGMQMNDQMVQFYVSQGMSLQDAQMKAKMDLEKLRTEQSLQQMKIEQDRDAANKKLAGDVVDSATGMIGGGMSAAAMSDENVKEDIAPADEDLYAFLDTLEPHSYFYKNEEHGKGKRVSVMAQELEETEMGDAFVFETEDGKAVDYGKGLGTMLAATAALHRRLQALEADAAKKHHEE